MPDLTGNGLYRADLLECLRSRDLFVALIDRRIFDEAQRYGCRAECNKARLRTAHEFFLGDYGRVLNERMPEGTESLDAFKLGAYVGFWLRRLVPLNRLDLIQSFDARLALARGELTHLTEQQEFFILYGNEVAAFRIAFEIVHFCQVSLAAEDTQETVQALLASQVLVPSERTVREIAVTLKHKNNSPHSLYITLLSLFDNLVGG